MAGFPDYIRRGIFFYLELDTSHGRQINLSLRNQVVRSCELAMSSQGVNFAPVTGGNFWICGEHRALPGQARGICVRRGANLVNGCAFY
jgi:hypothetical protein